MSLVVQGEVSPACNSCKQRKRKCDRQHPKCSSCLRKDFPCEYPTPPTRHRHALSQSQQYPSPQSNSTTVVQSPGPADLGPPASEFPAVFYLDWNVFHSCHVELPKPGFGIPSAVVSIIGNSAHWEAVAAEYFATIHTWMPIISKKRFYEKVVGASSNQLRSDYALLVLCMELIMWMAPDPNPRTPAYLAAKSFYLDLEIGGIVSIQVLQAGILIALFEIGHAIFPSASVSIEACACYGYALGINWEAAFPEKKPFSWIEKEEQNRVWWAVVILDRLGRVGDPRRPFLTENPCADPHLPADHNLPADDAAWDEGIMPTTRLGILHPRSNQDLGRFALTAEATILLGQVLRHVEVQNFDDHIHDEEALLLHRALIALQNVVELEGKHHNVSVMNQTAMCSIALVILHEAHTSRKTQFSRYFADIHHTKHVTESIVQSRAELAEGSFPLFESCVKDGSPFLTTLLYLCAISNLRMNRENETQETFEALIVMKATLESFNRRWRASGAYLEILEARQVSRLR